jgi:glutamate-ammonia-ligase adenylyltransferase
LRLRPEGDAGPLSRSLESCENYTLNGANLGAHDAHQGSGVAGDGQLAAEFLEMISRFVFRVSLNEGVLREIAGMKDRIENEVVRSGELGSQREIGAGWNP